MPKYINKNLRAVIITFLEKHCLTINDIGFWAIHPGGRRIIEEVQNALGISRDDTLDSWNILKNYGNMLSPSVIFVLESIMKREKAIHLKQQSKKRSKYGLAISFSPGVGVECLLLKCV